MRKLAQAQRFLDLLSTVGRRCPLRDPTATVVEEMQLTPVQLNSVVWLGRDGPHTMGDLARKLGSSERAVTGIVDRLERDGLARRIRSQADRRVITVELTPRGTAAFRKLSARLLAKTGAFLAVLEHDDREALFRILERIATRSPARRGEDGTP